MLYCKIKHAAYIYIKLVPGEARDEKKLQLVVVIYLLACFIIEGNHHTIWYSHATHCWQSLLSGICYNHI